MLQGVLLLFRGKEEEERGLMGVGKRRGEISSQNQGSYAPFVG